MSNQDFLKAASKAAIRVRVAREAEEAVVAAGAGTESLISPDVAADAWREAVGGPAWRDFKEAFAKKIAPILDAIQGKKLADIDFFVHRDFRVNPDDRRRNECYSVAVIVYIPAELGTRNREEINFYVDKEELMNGGSLRISVSTKNSSRSRVHEIIPSSSFNTLAEMEKVLAEWIGTVAPQAVAHLARAMQPQLETLPPPSAPAKIQRNLKPSSALGCDFF